MPDGFAVPCARGLDVEDALRELVPAKVERVHFVRTAGGLQASRTGPRSGTITPSAIPCPPCARRTWRSSALLVKLRGSGRGHAHLGHLPLTLLKEMFTVKGAGSVIRRGSRIFSYQSIREIQSSRTG
ncbi:MAG: hypothetical protein U1F77_04510 [Kiritimatiellia bacterium]